jgi:hypothetical protein
MVTAVENKNVVVRIDTHTGNLTKREPLRQLGPAMNDLVGAWDVRRQENRHNSAHEAQEHSQFEAHTSPPDEPPNAGEGPEQLLAGHLIRSGLPPYFR